MILLVPWGWAYLLGFLFLFIGLPIMLMAWANRQEGR